MKTSECVNLVAEALAKAHAKIGHAEKDAKNPHFKNDYASLESVIDAGKAALLEQGVFVIQGVNEKSVVTRLQHVSGQFFETELALLLTKQDMQGLGSAITYARRYSLAAMLNISQVDDDGEGSKPQQGKQSGPQPAPKPATKAAIAGMLKAFQGLGISEAQVCGYLQIGKSENMNEQDIEDLKRAGQAIKEGKIKIEDYFPVLPF